MLVMNIEKVRQFIEQENKENCKERKKILLYFIPLLLIELAFIIALQFINVSTAPVVSVLVGIIALFTLKGMYSMLSDPALKDNSTFVVHEKPNGFEIETDSVIFEIDKEK